MKPETLMSRKLGLAVKHSLRHLSIESTENVCFAIGFHAATDYAETVILFGARQRNAG
jgi:hypothetical protein